LGQPCEFYLNTRYNRDADDIGLDDDVDPNSEFPSYRNEHGAAR
jgi:hypothetical protein